MRTVLALLLAGGLITLAACFKAGSTPTAAPVSITLLPSTTAITPGQSVTVMANVYDQSGQGASWTVSPLNFGALSKLSPTSVTYTAPTDFATTVTVTITATSVANPNVTSSVKIVAASLSVSLVSGLSAFPFSNLTLNQGDQLPVIASVLGDTTGKGIAWTLSPASGEGSLIDVQRASVTYVAPGTVSSPITVTLTAAAVVSPNILNSVRITVFPSGAGSNVAVLNVDGGPVPGQIHPNGAFTSITLCKPGSTSSCQNISGVLVDTGSYGLRILQSAIPLLTLPRLTDGLGNLLENCRSFANESFLWGPVSQADIYVAGEFASAVPIQVVSDLLNETVPIGCSNGGSNQNTPQLLGANGILGVGPEPNDCTLTGVNSCNGSSQGALPNVYYACPTTGCSSTDSPVVVQTTYQVANPIPLFNADSNGLILQLPAVSQSEPEVQGTLTFGIGTEPNNLLGNATIFTLDKTDQFTTIFNGQTLTSSFLDSGAEGLFFPDTLPVCSDNREFFCPGSLTDLSATVEGASEGKSTVAFSVANADDLFSADPGDSVFGSLAGPQGSFDSCTDENASCVFDWGLPFFYGRSVYEAIDGQTVSGTAAAPWWAF